MSSESPAPPEGASSLRYELASAISMGDTVARCLHVHLAAATSFVDQALAGEHLDVAALRTWRRQLAAAKDEVGANPEPRIPIPNV